MTTSMAEHQTEKKEEREVISYSQLQSFKNCRMLMKLRYVDQIVPIDQDEALFMGTLVHRGLASHYGGTGHVSAILTRTDEDPQPRTPEAEERDWELRARAVSMLNGYVTHYGQLGNEDFEFVTDEEGNKAIEYQFCVDIINPETNAKSRSFVLGGKCDGIVKLKKDGTYWILEHKTARAIDMGYLEKLWTDFQSRLYKRAIERLTGLKISGILYNVMVKTGIRRKKGETREEFEIKYAEACAKNKSGKSSITQAIEETREEFFARLGEQYDVTPEERALLFHREPLIFDEKSIEKLELELWELTQQLLDARRRPDNAYYQNGGFCWHWNKACPYFKLCRSEMNPLIRDNFYTTKGAHEELDFSASE